MSNLKNLKLIDTIQDIPIHKTSEAATLRKEGLSTKNIQLIEIETIENTTISTEEESKVRTYCIRKKID